MTRTAFITRLLAILVALPGAAMAKAAASNVNLGAVARGDKLAGRQHGVPGAPEVQVGGLTPLSRSVRAPKSGSGQAPAYRAGGTTRAGGSHP